MTNNIARSCLVATFLATAIALTGCGSTAHNAVPVAPPPSVPSFFPAYLDALQPSASDSACKYPHDWRDMMIPCNK